jgi:hypothetical protein
MSFVPGLTTTVSRRRLLTGAAALVALGATSAACGSPPPPPDIDELQAQVDRAEADGRLATEAARGAPKDLAAALAAVTAERAEHARALTEEITRILGARPSATTTTASSSTAPPARPPSAADVIAALRQSAESAAGLAEQQSGYRTGLLASIAASCTASASVALATDKAST